ncbi:hypothetical protein SAMN05428970_0328 [Agromyces sp. CF514]|uniref:hypothetical protein n=1 Tax=Agromyces sp. CF514 TaxID=1881031 RepID=UPI0008E626F8|nr:hypothetical protein [Agromyces sp. CF514]SFR68040.1 hypothetical protein SAMN05428970_0328 [Agromyces sp. CF514]
MPHATAPAAVAAAPLIVAADGYIDDAVQALSTSTVYVAPDATDVDSQALQAQLTSLIGSDSIGVAVLSPFADDGGATGVEIARELVPKTGYDTIIVSIDGNLSAASLALPVDEALRIANVAEENSDSVEAALTTTVQEVQAAEPAASGSDGGGGAGGLVLGLAITAAVLAAGAATAFGVIRARRRRGAIGARDGRLPDPIRQHVATLRSLSTAYGQVGAAGNQVAAQTSTEIAAIAVNVEELFARLDQRSGADQRGLAAIELDATLRRLTGALDRDYLLDILTHPQLWDDPDERVREVRNAVTAVSDDLVQNIRQVNARRGLHFQVSLDGLVGKRAELQEWERAFEQATDDGQKPPT